MSVLRHLSVQSSSIMAVGYCRTTKTMEVIFNSSTDAIYRYIAVEPEAFLDLINSESIGSHFAKMKHNYSFEKIAKTASAHEIDVCPWTKPNDGRQCIQPKGHPGNHVLGRKKDEAKTTTTKPSDPA